MIERRPVAFASGQVGALFLRFGRSFHDLMEPYLGPPMTDFHSSVDQFLNDHRLGMDPTIYLVEFTVVLDRVVILQGSFRLDAEDHIEVNVNRTMQVLLFLRCNTEPLVIDGEVGGEKLVGFVYRADTLKPHLLDQPVLECLEEALNPSFGLR